MPLNESVTSETSAPSLRSRDWSRVIVGLLIGLHAALGLHTAANQTVTHDELWHLPVGLLNLRERAFHFDRLNPPLTRMWCALPLWMSGVDVDATAEGPGVGGRFIKQHPDDFPTYYVWGRWFNVLLSVATIWLLALWARQLMNGEAAVLVTLLYVTSPNILAHISLVTPEAGLMLTTLATLYLYWRWTQHRSWGRAICVGVALGLAMATKFTAILLYPVLVAVWVMSECMLLLRRSRQGGRQRELDTEDSQPSALARWCQLPTAFVLSLVVLNAMYLFEGSFKPLDEYTFQSTSMREVRALLDGVSGLPVPFPEDYLIGLDTQRSIMEGAHPVFLDGEWSLTGFPDYYFKTLLYKLPHLQQVLFTLGGCLLLIPGRRRLDWSVVALLSLPVVLLLGIASTTSMQLGVRYTLLMLPLAMLLAGQVGVLVASRSRVVRVGALIVVLFAGLWSLRHHPHHLAYFNEYAGGPVGGRQHLLDSNIDWGQDLHLVREYMESHDIDSIGLAYFGTVPPEMLGIRFHLPPGLTRETQATWSLPSGWYAVSVNYVMGRPHVIPEPGGGSHSVNPYEFGYFRNLEPVARLGYSIDIYHVDDRGMRSR